MKSDSILFTYLLTFLVFTDPRHTEIFDTLTNLVAKWMSVYYRFIFYDLFKYCFKSISHFAISL